MTAATVDTTRWLCRPCGTEFIDEEGTRPCPRCGNANPQSIDALDGIEEQAIEQARKVMKGAPVKSAPLTNGKPAGKKTARDGAPIIGLFAFLFGVPAWLEGARTTRDGWVFGLNWVLDRAALPFHITSASAWHWGASIGLMIALGWAYSRVELRWAPVRPPKDLRRDFFNPTAWHFNRSGVVWLIWLLVLFTDVLTMFLGARQARPSDPTFLRQIAASVTAAWIYAIIITFLPDRLIRFGWRSIRG